MKFNKQDENSSNKTASQILTHALSLHAQGLSVIPLKGQHYANGATEEEKYGNAKRTLLREWKEYQSRIATKNEIEEWFTKWPMADIGIVTGPISKLFVLDIDENRDGKKSIFDKHIPSTVTVLTNKGLHYYFKWNERLNDLTTTKKDIIQGVDIRGKGGYVVAPPSKGYQGKGYSWEEGRSPSEIGFEQVPEWVYSCLAKKLSSANLSDNFLPENNEDRENWVTDLLRGTQQGSRRTDLSRLFGYFHSKKKLPRDIVTQILLGWNKKNDPPLDQQEFNNHLDDLFNRYERENDDIQNKKTTGKGFLPKPLALKVAVENKFISSPIDLSGKGVRLLVYLGGVFKENGGDIARRIVNAELGNQSNGNRIESVVELIKEDSKLHSDQLNPKAKELINLKNGMLDWKTGELLSHSPDYKSTFQINAEYRPYAKSEILDKFLKNVLPEDTLMLIEEALGLLMIPETKFQRAVMLHGQGANGKSTFLAAIEEFIGKENVSSISLQGLSNNRFLAAELNGKLANIYSDLPDSAVRESDIFKSLVAGDPLTAERKYGNPFKFNPFARLLFSANKLPPTKDLTDGFFRRWIIIPFPNEFKGKSVDPNMVKKLTTPNAKSALLNKAIKGLRRLMEQGDFSKSQSVHQASESYRMESDEIYEFLKEVVERDPTLYVLREKIYALYLEWCRQDGIEKPKSRKNFNKRIVEIFKLSGDRRKEGKRAWVGIKLKDQKYSEFLRTSIASLSVKSPSFGTEVTNFTGMNG